jgi:hypothetical protein
MGAFSAQKRFVVPAGLESGQFINQPKPASRIPRPLRFNAVNTLDGCEILEDF